MPPIINMEDCNLCETCHDICPEDVFIMTDDGPQVVHPDECWYCGGCVMDCPESAITMKFPPTMRASVLWGAR